MSLIKNNEVTNIKTGLQTKYHKTLGELKNEVPAIATITKSSSDAEVYSFLGDFPSLQEWTGDRDIKSIKEDGYKIENDIYESTVSIKRSDIEDGRLASYGTTAVMKAKAVINFQNQKVYDALKNGFTKTCFDGQYFFDTDHPLYPNADATGTATTVSNLILGTKTPWYLISTTNGVNPIIFQERTSPNLEDQDTKASDSVFMRDEYLMGIRYRVGVGYGFWQTAVASKQDLTNDTFDEAFAKFGDFKAHGGRPLGIMPDTLVVPLSLRADANKVIKRLNLDNGSSNSNYDAVKVVVSPYL